MLHNILSSIAERIRKDEPSRDQTISEFMARKLDSVNSRIVNEIPPPPGQRPIPLLVHTITVPDDFHYCALSTPTRQSIKWRKSLQRHCCRRTGIEWYYKADEKLIVIAGYLRDGRSSDRVLKHMERAIVVLTDWITTVYAQQ
jgi:hypothetical protein